MAEKKIRQERYTKLTGDNGVCSTKTETNFLFLGIVQLYHRERILETSTLSCNEEEEEITKPPKR
jgi:hypothetical protein